MATTLKGIDVSKHQGNIDWAKVKADGIEFAIIRAGYGKNTVDEKFKQNVQGCISNNIPFGFYWFLYCTNVAEATQNAVKFADTIAPYKDKIKMKVWCDFEYDTDKKANAKGVVFTKQLRTDCVKAFCETLKSYGYEVGNYANPDYIKNKFNAIPYPLWYAKYSLLKGSQDCFMWQYSSKGTVKGISGNVDMNKCYIDSIPDKPKVAKNTLKRGAKGDEVKILQLDLNYFGAKLTVDGSFGGNTETALKDWQKKNGLTVDGSYGPASFKKMSSLLS